MTSEDTPICVTEALHSCRCCLQRAPDKDLTTPYTHLGNTEIYLDMLKECFEIHMMLDAEGECGICDVCVGRLRDASAFKLQVQRSQRELQAQLRGELQARASARLFAEHSDGKWFELQDSGHRDHTYAKTERPPAAVAINGENEDGADSEPARPVSARARGQMAMACSVRLERLRGDEAPHASQTCLATSRRGPRLASRVKDTPDDAEEQAYTCDTCGEHFTDKSGLIKHIQEHVGPMRDVCNETYLNKCDLKQQKMIHTAQGPSRRGLASRMADTPDDTEQHTLKSTRNELIRTLINKTYNGSVFKKQLTDEGDWTVQIRKHNEQTNAPSRCWPSRSSVTDMPDDTAEQNTLKSNTNEYVKTYHIDKIQTSKHNEQSPFEFNASTLSLAVKSSFIKRQSNHTIKRYVCNSREKQFTRKYYTDTGQITFMCDFCGKTFADSSTLRQHRQTHADTPPYTCDICSKKCRCKSDLVRHITRIHGGHVPYTPRRGPKLASRVTDTPDDTAGRGHMGPFEFNACNLSLAVKSSFRNHQPNSTRKRYTCDTCEKQFTCTDYLDRHLRTHTGVKPFMCDACGKRFAESSTLRRHRQTHADSQPYTCDICSKKYSHKGTLVRHIMRHAGHRPYICDVCSKTFPVNSDLRKHQRIHSKPYICEICGKQFARKSRLANHFIRH